MVGRTTVLAAALIAGCTAVGAVVPAHAADETRRYMSGWLPYWSTETSTTSFLTNSDVFSDISPFWHDARWDGSEVYIKNHLTDVQMTTALARLRGQGVKILPSITDGSGRAKMATTLASETKRTAHVQEIANLVLTRGYDGIDLDYETFAFTDGQSSWATTRPNWVAFVKELGSALHAQGKLLSVTTPPMSGTTGGYWVYDYAGIADSVDILRIMAYDYSVGSPGPIAPLWWVEKVAANAVALVPKAKVQLGIPVYGRNWFVAKTGKCPVGQTINASNYSMTSAGALASLAKDGVAPGQITRDAASGEQTVSYSITYKGLTDKGEMTECTVSRKAFFADATSVADRVKAARSAGLGGAALWTIGGESADQWPAVREAVGVVKDNPAAPQTASVRIGAPKFIVKGQQGSFTAEVTIDGKPSGGGSASLQMNPVGRGGWQTVATEKVPDTGLLVFSYAPVKSGAVRIDLPASGARKAARSAALATKVRAAVSVKSAVVAFTGQKVRLEGTVSPARKAVKVVRQRLVDGLWETFGVTYTDRSGNYRFSVTPTVKNGSYTYRVVSAPFTGYARGFSATVSFRSR